MSFSDQSKGVYGAFPSDSPYTEAKEMNSSKEGGPTNGHVAPEPTAAPTPKPNAQAGQRGPEASATKKPASFAGTKGIPVFPQDTTANGKVGNPNG